MSEINAQEVNEALNRLQFAEAQVFKNITLFPLITTQSEPRAYLFLDEAIPRGLARVTEVSEAGRVPELAFENSSAEKILLVDGDELIGAKQNRIVNLSILVGGGKRVVIPVSCVEVGRWRHESHDFRSAGRAMFRKARAKKIDQVSHSMMKMGTHASDQSEIWRDVEEKVLFARCDSKTTSMSDAFDSMEKDLHQYVEHFQHLPNQSGAVVAINGKISGLELFDSPDAFAKYLGKLIRSYAMDALQAGRSRARPVSESAAKLFLEEVRVAMAERFASIGEGEDIRFRSEYVTGAALAKDGRLVHLAGYNQSSL